MIFICGKTGCTTPVSGIYCDQHKSEMAAYAALERSRGIHVGESVTFDYRGKERHADVEKVGRTKVTVFVEVGHGSTAKRRKVLVPIDTLKGRTA